MAFFLGYGQGETVCVDLPPESVRDYSRPNGEPVEDAARAVVEALRAAIDFPPLAQATVPGDRIVIAVERGIPQLPAVIQGIVQTLLAGSAQPHEIAVVLADPEDRARQPLAGLPPSVRELIRITVHDPADAQQLTYLAAARDGRPIYFQRLIADADVVIPVGLLRLDDAWGYFGVHGCLFPTFSDQETRARFQSTRGNWQVQQRHGRKEAEEAAWLLGVQFTVQIMPGAGDSILQILAGEARAVARRGSDLCESAWLHRAGRRASLVVASIEGGEPEQTWDNVARALDVAAQAVADGGSIVLCTRLQEPPHRSVVKQLARAGFAQDSAVASSRETAPPSSSDAFTAQLLSQTLDRANVFLLSRLEEDIVEDLGLGHVAHADEVTRLSRRHESCILVGNAQHARIATDE
ncbi:MAG: lactate racemase domain-containing protein [Pirellulaceae bacterium]